MSSQQNRPYCIEPFDPARHDRDSFSCGITVIDNYFRKTHYSDGGTATSACWDTLSPSARDRLGALHQSGWRTSTYLELGLRAAR
ncbi:hypothetical protein CCR95_21335 [Thiocystis minor]|nr:hypothetical protein [Thiocystis minor]